MLRALQWEKTAGRSPAELIRWIAKPVALAAMMYLLMQAELLMHASPLAIALMAAALAKGENAAALAAGCLLGALRFPLEESALLPAIGCALVLGLELIMYFVARLRPASMETRCALTAGLGTLLPLLIYANGDEILSLQALGCGALAATAAPFMLAALGLRSGRGRLMLQEKTGLMLLMGAILAGLQRIQPGGAQAAAALMVLALPGLGCSAGMLGGLALVAGGADMLHIASLGMSALAAGRRICSARWQRSAAACATAALIWIAAGSRALHPLWMLCAAAIYMLMPERLLRVADEAFTPADDLPCAPDRIAKEATMEARRRLQALGDAFCEMAQGCETPSNVPDEQELICEMRSRLCSGCPGYADCWNGQSNRAVHLLCRLISDALDRVDAPQGMRVLFSDGEIPPDILRICRRGRMIPDRLGLLLRDFAQKRRSEIKRCVTGRLMSVQFRQAGEILYDLAGGQAARSSLHGKRLNQLQAALDQAGLGECTAMVFAADRIVLSRPGGSWTRDEVRRAAAAVRRAMDGRFHPELRDGSLYFVRKPRLSAQSGASCQSGAAGEICGDSHIVRMLDRSRLLIILSDGMGSGKAAAEESMETLRLLWRFLDAGIDLPLALETVNQQLLMRNGDEIYATVDLCIIDMDTGMAQFTKLAACHSLILRGKELMQVEGGRLPLGILEKVQPSISRVRLRPGDVIVMGSDGVMEAEDGMIERIIRRSAQAAPEQMAEEMVREAALRHQDGRRDDMTCICVRICAAE